MRHLGYGTKKTGFSFEHYNFYDSLVKMNHGSNEVVYFPFDELLEKLGKEKMNEELIRRAMELKPDLCFFFLSRDEIKQSTLTKLSNMGLTTFNWFADDHWRFEVFSKHYAKYFSFVSTTDIKSIPKYQKMGYKKVIKTQWGCNNFLYKPMRSNKNYDVTFVGQKYGERGVHIDAVRDSGIDVKCWGYGWEAGRISQSKMLGVFSHSKININFSTSSPAWSTAPLRDLGAVLFRKEVDGTYRFNPIERWIPSIKLLLFKRHRPQIKGRVFEVPGCDGFLLTEMADDIQSYYKIGKEISVFKDEKELLENIAYYLNNKKERMKVAHAGYKRTIREHTYECRFNELFKKMGLNGTSQF